LIETGVELGERRSLGTLVCSRLRRWSPCAGAGVFGRIRSPWFWSGRAGPLAV